MFAIVDASDFEWISQWKWRAEWNSKTRSYYAVRTASRTEVSGKREHIRMHRLILGLPQFDPRQGDHICSGQTLDNRRLNLRTADRVQNGYNRRPNRNSSVSLKGVTFHKRVGKWQAQIQVDRKKRSLGYFTDPESAHAAYCEAANRLHGEFARTT